MFISIGQKLRGLGNVRVGFRLKGSTAWFMIIFYAIWMLMWYLLIGTLWCIYGFSYVFFYLPIKGIMKLYKSKKTSNNSFTSQPQPDGYDNQNTPTNNNNNNNNNKTITILRWVGVGIFGAMGLTSLLDGGFISALLFVSGGLLIAPIPVIQNLRQKFKLNKIVTIILVIALLLTGSLFAPSTKDSDTDAPKSTTAQQTTQKPASSSNNTTASSVTSETTSKKATSAVTTQDPSQVIVYYTASGSKYHSRETCPGLSNANNIYSTNLETAQGKNLSPCSKCH